MGKFLVESAEGKDEEEICEYISTKYNINKTLIKETIERLKELTILSTSEYKPPQKELPIPELRDLFIYITNACNLRCRHCLYASSAYPNELTTEELKEIINDFVSLGGETFIISGGEPLLRRDLPAILAYSYNKGLDL
ncbi:MAG: radical SAM protein [Candidatus Methanodesulfokora sp.]|jgi:sulfatase maturation enzyme AslB (radical SAM superfamily)